MTITNSGTQIDATPNAFSFNAITNAVLNSGYTSNAITVTGINTGTSISISNGRYRINAGGFTSTP
jgi:agarase